MISSIQSVVNEKNLNQHKIKTHTHIHTPFLTLPVSMAAGLSKFWCLEVSSLLTTTQIEKRDCLKCGDGVSVLTSC